MSVVLAICGNNYVKIASDGRAVLFSSDNPPIPTNENYNKVRHITKDVILGFAGDKSFCEKVVKKLKDGVKKIQYEGHNKTGLLEIAVLTQIIAEDMKLGFLNVEFIIGGMTDDGRMGLCTLCSQGGFKIEEFFPQYGEQQIKVALPSGVKNTYETLIEKHFDKNFPKTLYLLDERMGEFIDDVADADITVNKTHFVTTIIKKPL